MTTFQCDDCKENKTHQDSFTTGYGLTADNRIICFECCGKRDAKEMQATGRVILYFDGSSVSNWPGSLKFKVNHVRRSRHNMARIRYDFWFSAFGQQWHGYQVGDNTQIAHCKRMKG